METRIFIEKYWERQVKRIGIYGNLNIGDKYGSWTIISKCIKNKFGKDSYLCKCICGTEKYVEGQSLVKGKSKSCGCVRKVSKEIQKERIKKYKHDYFQNNKEKIYKRTLNKQKEQRKLDYELYGIDRYNLKSKYNLSIEEYHNILQSQDNKCAICGCDISNRNNNPHIDHNHKNGKVRGILCGNCNMGIGHLKDNVLILKNAIKYLEDN